MNKNPTDNFVNLPAVDYDYNTTEQPVEAPPSPFLSAAQACANAKRQLKDRTQHVLKDLCQRIADEANDGGFQLKISKELAHDVSFDLQKLGYKVANGTFWDNRHVVSWDNV